MRTLINLKFYVWIVICFLFASQGFGQETVEQYNANGLSTTIFHTTLGEIILYLPEHAANESISGTLFIEPNGSTNKKRAKHLAAIKRHKLSLGNSQISLLSASFKLVSEKGNNSLQLLNEKGKVIANSTVQSSRERLTPNSITHIPNYMVSGESAKITARCDGNLENNKVIIRNKNVPILAESESGVFFKVPNDGIGRSDLQFTNEDEVVETLVNILELNLSVGKTNLLRTETTNLSMNISGLAGLEAHVPITVTNNSISNITLEGGNVQKHIINPETDTSSGDYSKNISVRALQSGGFSISVKIEPSQLETASTTPNELLCNCYLSGKSYLISSIACLELEGHCSENIKEDTEGFDEDETPPEFKFAVPEVIITQGDKVNLFIKDLNDNDCIAVVFFFRSIDDRQWHYIGEDTSANNGLSFQWNPSNNSDGVYIIRAQVVNRNNITSERLQYVVFNNVQQTESDNSLGMLYSISQGDIDRAIRKARATGDRIKEEKERLGKLEDKGWDAEERKKENEAAKSKLVAIDKVLDSIPKTYKDDFKRIIDSLASLKIKLPDVIDPSVLQKAIDDAQSRVDDCNKRLDALKKEQAELEKERDDLKNQLDVVQEAIYKLHIDNGWVGGYGYHPDGRPWHGYVGGESANVDLGDEKYELKKQYRELKKQYLKTLKRLGELPSEILEAEKDCEELNEALEKARTAKETTNLHAATELESNDICRQIKRLLGPLRQWCHKNPKHCDFKDKIEELLKRCPKNIAELNAFWEVFNDIISGKKNQEDAFGEAAEKDQKEIDAIDDNISELEDRIKGLEDRQRKEFEEADRLRKQRATEAADAKARADAKKRERNKQKKEDEKIKNLIKKARSGDAGEEALKDLAKGMGLDMLDEATGNFKLGKIIGGLLVIKDMPNCVCPLIKALRDAIAAHRRGEDPFVYVNDYILKWKKCANLPSISSIMEGSQQLTEAIQKMNKDQSLQAINALNRAIRVQCD